MAISAKTRAGCACLDLDNFMPSPPSTQNPPSEPEVADSGVKAVASPAEKSAAGAHSRAPESFPRAPKPLPMQWG